MKSIACIVVILFLSFMMSDAQNYCSICSDHTMCRYWGVGPLCARRKFWGVSGSTKNQILDIHNRYRRYVAKGYEKRGDPGPQPAAANMNKLEWDDELARIAQRWADQCNFKHDKCRNVERYKWVGQNLYISGVWRSDGTIPDGNQNWEEAIAAFYDEVVDFNHNNVDRFGTYVSKKKTGHYTELVWGNTLLIGCGFAGFMEWKDGKDWYHKYYACNYAPGGNVLEAQVYEKGNACSKCPSNMRCQDGLCIKSTSVVLTVVKNLFPSLYSLLHGK